jgi:hypothetical protein
MASRRRFPRRGRGDPQPIGTLLAQSEAARALSQVAVPRKTWEEVAGVAFSRRTAPERLDRGVLWVVVSSPAWSQELALHAPLILERLRARGVDARQLRFRVGVVPPPDRGGVVAPAERELARIGAEAAATDPRGRPAASVKDEALRELIATVGRSLARAEAMEAERERVAQDRKPRIPGKR